MSSATTTSTATTVPLQRPPNFRRLSTMTKKRRSLRTSLSISSRSNSLDSTDSANRPLKKRVRFARKVETFDIIHWKDMNEQEISDCWFLPEECQPSFRQDTDCFRGLEQMTKEGMAKQYKNTRAALDAVLHEQNRQRYRAGVVHDETIIAAVYIQKSRHCRTEARKVGVLDAHDAGISIDDVVASIKAQKERHQKAKKQKQQQQEQEQAQAQAMEEPQHSDVATSLENEPMLGGGSTANVVSDDENDADYDRRLKQEFKDALAASKNVRVVRNNSGEGNKLRRAHRDSLTKKRAKDDQARSRERNASNVGVKKRRNYFRFLVRRSPRNASATPTTTTTAAAAVNSTDIDDINSGDLIMQ